MTVSLIFTVILGLSNKKLRYYEEVNWSNIGSGVQKRSTSERTEMTLSILGKYVEIMTWSQTHIETVCLTFAKECVVF